MFPFYAMFVYNTPFLCAAAQLPSQISPFLEVDNLVLTIKRDQPRVEASAVLRFFSNEQQIRLRRAATPAADPPQPPSTPSVVT